MRDRTNNAEPIAIIGSSCRFPSGCDSPSKLWELLKYPVDLQTNIPQTRFNSTGFYHENAEHPGTTNVTKAYLLDEDLWAFDNEFFGISAREAESMDPQQRIILETVYESIESAGYSISELKGSSTGVFVGQMTDDYRDLILRDVDCHSRYTGTGIARSILANRVSYVFDWKGPSVNVDTACSSSLVALHQAVQSLRNEESEMAIVAGVNLVFSPEMFSFLSSLRMLSPTGRSRMWDANADGYARGEGFAAVVIKTLKKALVDGDDIEGVIRNTGVNQDGRSAGLTVPSATAQAELMKFTYSRCGLDCKKEEDRCQYFEAHGTGTLAGDLKEAEGINLAFFPNDQGSVNGLVTDKPGSRKVYVGSIKTVIGHLEGTAGIASLLKASQAVQHGLIPPNLHFDRLNPEIEPFYHHLEVPTRLMPWPKLPEGVPRRASVNSTNAHVIVENWGTQSTATQTYPPSPCWGPFVFSANSEKALEATITSLSVALQKQNSIDISKLAWTLQAKRTQFNYRASFSAASKQELIACLDASIKGKEQSSIATKATRVSNGRILGVFTGQGAQWVSMGASLFVHSSRFRRTIQQLESTLKGIPFGPSWSLTEELLRHDDPMRISSAEISQPLCTALQVALVDLLKECGVTFSAVVGHSSGEIAAAYAAGVLESTDAILIACYRGYHCQQARRCGKKPGKMMAVSMAPEDAEAFCRQSNFLGRINVAAKNSHSSTTLSGDSEAIDEVKVIMDGRAIFARILMVDNAYHSHHMRHIGDLYLESLKESGIRPRRSCFGGACNWYSSVYNSNGSINMTTFVPFEHAYWVENMTNPVLFSHAITMALQEEHFDLALEIGPHPALKAPAIESIKDASGNGLPYQGVLKRNEDALSTFSSALGFIWARIDSPTPPVDFAGFQKACNGSDWVMPRVEKGLPSYPWDHDRSMLKESKKSKAWRTRDVPIHELLGYPTPSGKTREVRWRNILRLGDLDWLQGHKFQNQVLLPASGYLAMAVNAALNLVEYDKPVQLIELQDVVIHNGIVLEESGEIETKFIIKTVDEDFTSKTAEFSCHCSNADAASAEFDKEVFTGRVIVKLGHPIEDALPSRIAPSLPMTDVALDRFYSWTQKIGLEYSKPFLLDSIRRRLNVATVTTTRTVTDKYMYTVHPATLDSILQSLYAAFSYPGDGRLWTTYLPKSFRRVRFNPNACRQKSDGANLLLIADCYLTKSSARTMCGDIDVFCAGDGLAEVQAQGVVFSSLEVPSVTNDQKMFWQTVWKRELSPDVDLSEAISISAESYKLHEICERTAYFYLNQLCEDIEEQEITSMEWYLQCLMHWALEFVRPSVQSDQHPRWRAHWSTDTLESIMKLKEHQYENQIDLELIHYIGSRLPSVLRGSVSTLQVLRDDARLEKLYTDGLGVPEINIHLGALLDHLVHQYPRMRILEIGAGTGGSTSVILRHLRDNLESYTFTDVSQSFFPAAQARFAEYEEAMEYKVLDINQSPVEQNFHAHSYELVIAAHVLHATETISQTMKHCRELLRPGGHLILIELTNPATLRTPFLFSGLPGWWAGREDGRNHSPILTESQWDTVLRQNFFSGVDQSLRDFADDSMQAFSAMVSQAVDDRISVLRNPLNFVRSIPHIEKLLIIGGRTLVVCKMAAKLQSLLSPFSERTSIIHSLEEVVESDLKYGSAVICLSELEDATFARMSQKRISAVQALFREAKFMLWATQNCRDGDPYANIIVGIGRSVSREMAHLRLKLVDFDKIHLRGRQTEAIFLSEMLLRMICLDLPGYDDILWSNETEVAIVDNEIFVPRVILDDGLNDCFNATRRRNTKTASPISTPIEMSVEESIVMKALKRDGSQISPPVLRVLSSSLFRFSCLGDNQPLYICFGVPEGTPEKRILAISKINGSAINLIPDHTFSLKEDIRTDGVLSGILMVVICESLLSSSTGTIWVHNADDCVAKIIYDIATRRDIPVFLTTSVRTSVPTPGNITYVHPQAVERELRLLIPQDVKRFVNMGDVSDSTVEFAAALPEHEVDHQRGIYHASVKRPIPLLCDRSGLLGILEYYSSQPDLLCSLGQLAQNTTIKADLVHEQLETTIATSVLSWAGVQSVQIEVPPLTGSGLFADRKTYFLVGFTGDVGLSLCEWMIDHGAKYLAIASRNPAIPPEVLTHLQRKGATIRIFSLDIASIENLRNVHQEIVSSMPPIAGVANAALVMRDRPFDSISMEELEEGFKPKVIGTQHLDQLFFSAPLDFFILFSSVVSIIGNPAQSSYNAANLFMSTVAAQRRKRGLAASIMHFGMLLGFGFIHEQAGPTVESHLRQDDVSAIPEPDLHTIFAQAIISGQPESGLDYEIICGLGTQVDTPWRSIPRFGHCRVKGQVRRSEVLRHGQERSTRSIRSSLEGACDSRQSISILKEVIASRLSSALGSPGEDVDEHVELFSLGLDSLVAIELRSWLLRILEVDVPVLKFLSGSSLHDICQDVLSKLPSSLRPWDEGKESDENSCKEPNMRPS
ncbi:hypothetical protein F5Y04DRAFT_287431 [Hypomontagnella monticulosa]|nr:hypothetical protein F5Y04DRAFT_287431 [Hypomontagnella monticulosa]